MSKLKKLEALADAALIIDHNESAGWYGAETIVFNGVYYLKNARFIAAANPATIKAMCALLVQMRDALKWYEGFDIIATNPALEDAISAFNSFDKE